MAMLLTSSRTAAAKARGRMRGGGEAFVCQLEKAKRECVRAAKTGLSRSSHVVCSHSSLEKKSFSLPHDARRPPRPPRPRAARRIRRRARPGADAAQGAGFGGEWARSFFFFVRSTALGWPRAAPRPALPPACRAFCAACVILRMHTPAAFAKCAGPCIPHSQIDGR